MKSSQKKPKSTNKKGASMPLDMINYLLVGIGATVIVFSYGIMYLENSANGFFAMNIAPISLLGSYALILFALLYRKKA